MRNLAKKAAYDRKYAAVNRTKRNAQVRARYRLLIQDPVWKAKHDAKNRIRAAKHRMRQPEYMQKYRAAHKTEIALASRKRKYGISKADFDNLLTSAGHKCQICGKFFTAKILPHIDHSHETGKVRGVLCRKCNLGLGHLQDSPILIEKALVYLHSHA